MFKQTLMLLIFLSGVLTPLVHADTSSMCPDGMSTLDCKAIYGTWTRWVPDNGTSCSAASYDENIPGSDNQQKAFNYFVDAENLSDLQSAAIVGNLMQESGVNPKSNQAGGPGMGIAQWSNPGRWSDLLAYAKQNDLDEFSLATQLKFMSVELHGGYSSVLAKLKQQTDVGDATGFFMGTAAASDIDPATAAFIAKYGRVGGYENPGSPALDNRIANANSVLSKYGGGAVSGSDSACGSVGSVDCSGKGATASGSLSQVRQNAVCIANGELAKWKSGALGPGGDFKKYTQGRDEEWCADFASWVYNQAGYPISTTSKDGNVPAVQGIRDIGEASTRFLWHSAGDYTPVPGDIVVYQEGESHVNIVVTVNSGTKTMTIVGGNQDGTSTANSSSRVSSYALNGFTGNHITGYVSPKD
jgi:hypothetical protein